MRSSLIKVLCTVFLTVTMFVACDTGSIYFKIENEKLIEPGSLPAKASYRFLVGPTADGKLYTVAAGQVYEKNRSQVGSDWHDLETGLDPAVFTVSSLIVFQGHLYVASSNRVNGGNAVLRRDTDASGKSIWVSLLSPHSPAGDINARYYQYNLFHTTDKLYVTQRILDRVDQNSSTTFDYNLFLTTESNQSLTAGSLLLDTASLANAQKITVTTGFNFIANIVQTGTTYWLGGNTATDGFLMTSADGISFATVSISIAHDRMTSFNAANDNLFIGFENINNNNASLIRSPDNASTWTTVQTTGNYGPVIEMTGDDYLVGSSAFNSNVGTGAFYLNTTGGIITLGDSPFAGSNFLATNINAHAVLQLYLDNNPPESNVSRRLYLSSARLSLWSIDEIDGQFQEWELE